MVSFFCALLSMLVTKREQPTPCYHDAHSVGTPNWAFRVKGWLTHCKTMFSLLVWTFFPGQQKDIFGGYSVDVSYWEGQASRASSTVFFTPGQLSVEFMEILLWILVLSFWRLLSTG